MACCIRGAARDVPDDREQIEERSNSLAAVRSPADALAGSGGFQTVISRAAPITAFVALAPIHTIGRPSPRPLAACVRLKPHGGTGFAYVQVGVLTENNCQRGAPISRDIVLGDGVRSFVG